MITTLSFEVAELDFRKPSEPYYQAAHAILWRELGPFDQADYDLKLQRAETFGAIDPDDQLLGAGTLYLSHGRASDTNTAWLDLFAVKRNFQSGHGIGSVMLRYAEGLVLENGLHSVELTPAYVESEEFFMKHGYEELKYGTFLKQLRNKHH